ncbi:MAG: TraB domain-containing protein [Candidatus Bathyarchaeota archaeon]|jgi:pheromone shutdown protein TraB
MEILDINYNDHVDLVGTAHFTRRSINDAYEAIRSLKPRDVAFELDWRRFQLLNVVCLTCSKRGSCKGLCEFTGAAKALGNVNANLWLIDMTEEQIRHRIRSQISPSEISNRGIRIRRRIKENPLSLWEQGFKERVINNSKKELQDLRKYFPSVYRVLIDERNTLMATRLSWIVSRNIERKKDTRILTFVGAAHVEGIKELLANPSVIPRLLKKVNLSFSKPTLIRRVAVH